MTLQRKSKKGKKYRHQIYSSTHRSLQLHPPLPGKHRPFAAIEQGIILHHAHGFRGGVERRGPRREPRRGGPVYFEKGGRVEEVGFVGEVGGGDGAGAAVDDEAGVGHVWVGKG